MGFINRHTSNKLYFKPALALAFIISCTVVFGQEAEGKEYLLGKFEPSAHPDFVVLTTREANRGGLYLRREARDAFLEMQGAAAKDGISLIIISATRNFDYQKGIWERKWSLPKYSGWTEERKARDILLYSSMPGTSRHHWGTDVDFCSVELSYWKSGEGRKVYDWLTLNAGEFGFCQTYTSKSDGRTGYEEEAWHWSYFPLSTEFLKSYNSIITHDDLNGFKGASQAGVIDVIKLYVNGVGCGLN